MKKIIDYIPTQKQFLLAIFSLAIMSCSEDIEENFEKEISNSEIDTSDMLMFKGLPVNHRFNTTEEDLNVNLDVSSYDNIYKKVRGKLSKKGNNIYGKSEISDIPLNVFEGALDNIIEEYPFPALVSEGFVNLEAPSLKAELETKVDLTIEEEWELVKAIYFAEKRDSIAIANNIEEVNLANSVRDQAKWDMIRSDFPTLSQSELDNNIDLIDEYYIKNIEYGLIEEVAEKGSSIEAKLGADLQARQLSEKECSMLEVMAVGLGGIIINTVAMKKAADNARAYASENYPSSLYAGTGDRRDAFRHIIWNALMCKYYVTISANIGIRVDIAKSIGDAYERCGENPLPYTYMDLHNNEIGRNLYASTSWYTRVLWTNVYVNEISNDELIRKAKSMVNDRAKSVLIVWRNLQGKNLAPGTTKQLIESSYCVGKPVYLQGRIATYNRVEYFEDYSSCAVRKASKVARSIHSSPNMDKEEPPCPMIRSHYFLQPSSYLPSDYVFHESVGFGLLLAPEKLEGTDGYSY